ncbi:mannosyltransferase 1 [Lasius niger]|uniref:Mannosyltransferase 1 n=1 Tax=Lasius niger TaxID=67767 RepID=A0A0J7KJZ6_LASNI|nr:mannosyltransferase 1 [Lasius niger]
MLDEEVLPSTSRQNKNKQSVTKEHESFERSGQEIIEKEKEWTAVKHDKNVKRVKTQEENHAGETTNLPEINIKVEEESDVTIHVTEKGQEEVEQALRKIIKKSRAGNVAKKIVADRQENMVQNREAYVNYDGVLKKISEIDASDFQSRKVEKYKEEYKGDCKVIVKLAKERTLTKRDKVNNKKDECGLPVSINSRSLTCKGVVADWPDSNSNVNMIRELWDAIDDKSDIVRLEKML